MARLGTHRYRQIPPAMASALNCQRSRQRHQRHHVVAVGCSAPGVSVGLAVTLASAAAVCVAAALKTVSAKHEDLPVLPAASAPRTHTVYLPGARPPALAVTPSETWLKEPSLALIEWYEPSLMLYCADAMTKFPVVASLSVPFSVKPAYEGAVVGLV